MPILIYDVKCVYIIFHFSKTTSSAISVVQYFVFLNSHYLSEEGSFGFLAHSINAIFGFHYNGVLDFEKECKP